MHTVARIEVGFKTTGITGELSDYPQSPTLESAGGTRCSDFGTRSVLLDNLREFRLRYLPDDPGAKLRSW